MIKIELDKKRRTITLRASGALTVEELKAVLKEAKTATDVFRGGQHIVLADLRGMSTMSPEAAAAFGEVIRYGREHGTALCVHMSDSSIARLQANRLAREVTPEDTGTVNVVSIEEARRVIDERYRDLSGPVV
jgi:ABC-type transporter Mla MlaB component